MCSAVAQVVNDGGEEEIACVARQAQSVEAKPVEIDFWVLECLADPGPGELFVSSSVAVILESCENVFPLLGGEELGGCGVVMDEEVRSDGRDDIQ